MKTAFLIDFLVGKKILVGQLWSTLIVALCICLPIGNVYVALCAVVVALVVSTGFSLFAYDEQNGWERFRAGFPMSRSEIIWGRLAFIMALAAVSAAFGAVACLAISALSPLFAPALGPVFDYAPDAFVVDLSQLACVIVLTIAVVSLMMAVFIPLIAKFGMTRATRLAPLAFALVFVVMIAAGGESVSLALDNALSGMGPLVLCAIGLTVTAIICALTGAIAARLYEAREF